MVRSLIFLSRCSTGAACLFLVTMLAACSPGQASNDSNPAPAPARSNTVRCGDKVVTGGFDGDVLRLTAGGERFDMRRVEAASGAKYAVAEDPTTTFWSRGRTATLRIRGQPYPTCSVVPEFGLPFRAHGNEPS